MYNSIFLFVFFFCHFSGLAAYEYHYVPKCANALQSALTAVHDSHRIAAAVFFAEV